jgi:predicted nicotinamide N-methyase
MAAAHEGSELAAVRRRGGGRGPESSHEPLPDLEDLLDLHAPLAPVPLCPEIRAFAARSLVEIWEEAEKRAGRTLPPPFWAFPWPAGIALARVVLDRPEIVRGRTVIDVGCGGGVSSLACAKAGARVLAVDTDAIALEITMLAAARQGLAVEPLLADVLRAPEILDPADVVLSGDLAYDRAAAPLERAAFLRAAARGATVLLADAERTWFDAAGLEQLAEYTLPVVFDLEGVERRSARVYRLRTGG